MRVAASVLMALATPATAQQATVACAASPATPPPGFAGWSKPLPLAAAATAVRAPPIAIGTAARVALRPVATIQFVTPPQKPGDAASHGGLAGFTVTRAGVYRVGLSSGAWIDVIRDGKPLSSTTHGHGPACSGIRKIVDFQLAPGRYLLQLAASADPALTAMIVEQR